LKYNYLFKIVYINENHNILTIDLPKEIRIVSTFLQSDVQSDGHWFLEVIDKVLRGKEMYQEFWGNICILQIKPDKTIILDSLADDGIGDSCKIETIELKELSDVWEKEVKKQFSVNSGIYRVDSQIESVADQFGYRFLSPLIP